MWHISEQQFKQIFWRPVCMSPCPTISMKKMFVIHNESINKNIIPHPSVLGPSDLDHSKK
jgi:hypothetical protein